MINSNIGKYKITRLIGEGGMASVYEAEHEMLGIKVALKVLNPVLSANAQIRERFTNEAKMMATFNHPNITRIIDFDDQPHQLSIVMEFLEGEDLNEKIKRNGPMSEQEIKDIFVQTLSAFQYAHEKGVVHRDIKPSNIYVQPNGQVKILDFGIAKLFGQGNEMTQTGTQIGTPIYMSPEQVKADKSIDHRSDIYSLGVTMFYALQGKPPYEIDTFSQYEVFKKIVEEPLPELSIETKYASMIKHACAKDREERYQNCEDWLSSFGNKITAQTIHNPCITTRSFQIDKDGDVLIGTQIWMNINLEVDKFRNGDLIPQAISEAEWNKACESHQPAWCYYANDASDETKFGKLYNWYAIKDLRGIAPIGYHIPTDDEWNILVDYLGGNIIAGENMKSTNSWIQKGNGLNSFGFSGLPGGYRGVVGSFYDIGKLGGWWSSTEKNANNAWSRALIYHNNNVSRSYYNKGIGLSVRCLRD